MASGGRGDCDPHHTGELGHGKLKKVFPPPSPLPLQCGIDAICGYLVTRDIAHPVIFA